MIAYVTTQGARITREGRRLLVQKDGSVYHTLFSHQLEQLVVCGNVQLTTQAMRLLMRAGIDTVFLGVDGRYHGRLALEEPKNVLLRQRQFELVRDAAFCLKQARRIVTGKLLNMITVLQRIRRHRGTDGAGQAAERVRAVLAAVESAPSTESLRGLEGRATADYFTGLRTGFVEDFGFRRRVRRPPTDPVNAVLSLLYTFATNRVYAAVRLAGLDPYPGVYHALEYGRCSLPLDLVEELRPLLADTLTLSLFNLGMLKPRDFHTEASVGTEQVETEPLGPEQPSLVEGLMEILLDMFLPKEGMEDAASTEKEEPASSTETRSCGKLAVRLQPEAFRRVVTAFEKKMAGEFFHAGAGRRLSLSEALVYQARLFRRVIEGEEERYQPLLLK